MKRNEARKLKSCMISFRVDADYVSRLDTLAQQSSYSRAEVLRRCLVGRSLEKHGRCTGAHRGCTGARRPQPHRRPPQARHPRGRFRPVQPQQTEPLASRLHHPSPSGGGASSAPSVIVRHQRASASNKGFRQLARYIRGRSDKPRATWFLAANLVGVTGPRDLELACRLVEAVNAQNTRAGNNRTYHMVISLHPGRPKPRRERTKACCGKPGGDVGVFRSPVHRRASQRQRPRARPRGHPQDPSGDLSAFTRRPGITRSSSPRAVRSNESSDSRRFSPECAIVRKSRRGRRTTKRTTGSRASLAGPESS